MYRSHPVRRMCERPAEGETARLVVDPTDDGRSTEALVAAIGVVGGTVEAKLSYGVLRVDIPETRVTELCSLSGIERVETADVVGMAGDAGEDL